MAKVMSNHKFVRRSDGKAIYLGSVGKESFLKTKDAKMYHYHGPISYDDQAKEEAHAAEEMEAAKEKKENESAALEVNKGTAKRVAKKLTPEELKKIMAEKNIPLSKSEDNHYEPEEDDDDFDDEEGENEEGLGEEEHEEEGQNAEEMEAAKANAEKLAADKKAIAEEKAAAKAKIVKEKGNGKGK